MRGLSLLGLLVLACVFLFGCGGGGEGGARAELGRPAYPRGVVFEPSSGLAKIPGDERDVKLLDWMIDPARWRPDECTVTASELKAPVGKAIHMSIPVDHHGGEEKYPIGWPRMYHIQKPDDVDFSEYDYFEFDLLVTMSRPKPPASVISVVLHGVDKSRSYVQVTGEPLKLGQWMTYSKPISELDCQQIAMFGINISEVNYEHRDQLEFHFGGFRLVRSSHCRVMKMTADPAIVYSDRGVIRAEILVEGKVTGIRIGVPFLLSRGDEKLRFETLPVKRGKQTIDFDVSELRLAAGEYELTCYPDDPALRVSVPIRVVSSPWEVSK